jgi:hypothetical protein
MSVSGRVGPGSDHLDVTEAGSSPGYGQPLHQSHEAEKSHAQAGHDEDHPERKRYQVFVHCAAKQKAETPVG